MLYFVYIFPQSLIWPTLGWMALSVSSFRLSVSICMTKFPLAFWAATVDSYWVYKKLKLSGQCPISGVTSSPSGRNAVDLFLKITTCWSVLFIQKGEKLVALSYAEGPHATSTQIKRHNISSTLAAFLGTQVIFNIEVEALNLSCWVLFCFFFGCVVRLVGC